MFRVQSGRAGNEGGWPNHGALNDAGVDPGDARCFTGKNCGVASVAEVVKEPVVYIVRDVKCVQDLC